MLDRDHFAQWFGYIQVVMGHPDLNQDEKYTWIWLATHCANQFQHTCTFTYESISRAVNRPPKTVHSSLFRLKLMGLLNGNVPAWFGEPTAEMMKEERTLRPMPLSSDALMRQMYIKKMRENNIPIF